MEWVLAIMAVCWWLHAWAMQKQIDHVLAGAKVTADVLFEHLHEHERALAALKGER